MKRTLPLAGVSAVLAIGVVLITVPKAQSQSPTTKLYGAPAPMSQPFPRNAEDFDKMFNELKNWGRWGKDDEIGPLNLITNEKRKSAAALVKSGISVSLEHNPITEAAEDNAPGTFEHVMGANFHTDTLKFNFHGPITSHIDALCHYDYKGLMYNGVPISASSAAGCSKLGIQNLKNGIITRGVLIDIPRMRGLPYLEPGTPVYTAEIEAWEKKVGVKVGPGDAIFLHTGRWIRRAKMGPWNPSTRAGYHISVGPWFRARDVAIVSSDGAHDVQPSMIQADHPQPLHTFLIAGLGVTLLDSQDLTILAETAARLNRYEFMLVVAPIAVTGGTGSPVNALAVF